MALSTDPIQVVKDYLEALGPTADAFWKSFDDYFDDTTVWDNKGVMRTVGREEAIAFARACPLPFDSMTTDILKICGSGNTVFVERIDSFYDKSGGLLVSAEAVGVFEVSGRIISSWSDYFDTTGLFKDIEAANARMAAAS